MKPYNSSKNPSPQIYKSFAPKIWNKVVICMLLVRVLWLSCSCVVNMCCKYLPRKANYKLKLIEMHRLFENYLSPNWRLIICVDLLKFQTISKFLWITRISQSVKTIGKQISEEFALLCLSSSQRLSLHLHQAQRKVWKLSMTAAGPSHSYITYRYVHMIGKKLQSTASIRLL